MYCFDLWWDSENNKYWYYVVVCFSINLPRQSVFQIILYLYWKCFNVLQTLLSQREILPDSFIAKAFTVLQGWNFHESFSEKFWEHKEWTPERSKLSRRGLMCVYCWTGCISWVPGIHLALLAGMNCLSSVWTSR